MDEVRELRPRLDSRELRFLTQVLKAYEAMLTLKTEDFKAVEEEVQRLTAEFRKFQTHEILKQLKAKRAELSNLKVEQLSERAVVCSDFIRRFQELLDGKRPHPKWFATHCLRELTLEKRLEPKTSKKSQLSQAIY